jgi:hypothetical protein
VVAGNAIDALIPVEVGRSMRKAPIDIFMVLTSRATAPPPTSEMRQASCASQD